MDQPSLPLTGIRVLDLSRVLAGPYCTTLLSMLGAEVIKVEDASGDESRQWPPHRNGMSSTFMGMNLNKEGLVLNLKAPNGQQVLRDLATRSDVLVENFRTGTMEKFGLGYEALAGLNPRLVYVSISAFGRTGPKAKDAGYEALVQAYTGVMDITGFPEAEPVRCGVSFLDMATGVNSALAAVSLLYRREQTGRGGKVDASLLQTSLGLMTPHVSAFLQHDMLPRRLGTAHPSVVPYQAYRTADGNVFIASGNQNLWERLCRVLGEAGLIDDPRFKDNTARVQHRVDCIALVSQAIGRWQTDPLIAALAREGVPCTKVNNLRDVMDDGQVQAIRALAEMEDPDFGRLRFPNLPFQLDDQAGTVHDRAPRLGEHSSQVLRAMGYDERRIGELLREGAVQGE
jgi:crotonobetainyl-CoA:carnitine CoA-transferase CaiB-like acyl-CoA transferase